MTQAMQQHEVGATGAAVTTCGFGGNVPRCVKEGVSVATVTPGAESRAEAEQNGRWMGVPIQAASWAESEAEGLTRAGAPTLAALAQRS